MSGRGAILAQIMADLPRQGPGCQSATRQALSRLPPFGPAARILEFGAGTGAATQVLAELTGAQVLAVELAGVALRRLASSARAWAAGGVRAVCGDLSQPPVASSSVDLVWAEGAAYLCGFGAALAGWRPLLRPGGWLAVTELTWLVAEPAESARQFWGGAYPALQSPAANRQALVTAGYEPRGEMVLPREAWWENYYQPLAARLVRLREESTDPETLAVADELEQEIALWLAHGGDYGYVFYFGQASGTLAGRTTEPPPV